MDIWVIPFALTLKVSQGRDDYGDNCTSCLVVEDATKMLFIGKDICLMGKVGSTGVHKVDAW